MALEQMSPVPILLMVRELGSGGIERDVTKLARGLDRSRFTPFVATYRPTGIRSEELIRAGIPILHLQVSSFKSPRFIATAVQLGRFIRRQRIKIVHAFDSTAILGVPLARLLRVPAILTSTLGHRALLDDRTRQQFRITDHLADAIVVNCNAMRNHLIDDFSIDAERIRLCYNGVDTKEFYPSEPARADLPGITAEDVVIGTVCVLRPEKGLEVLQEAFAKARRSFPHVKLLIVGSGPQLDVMNRNSKRLGIDDASVMLPTVRDVGPVVRAMDIFVSSSHSEAFSNSILEAMASGCCVIASRVGGTPELVTDGQTGALFNVGDVDQLAHRLVELIQDSSLRKALGTKAAEFAADKLNIDIALRRSMEIYDDLLRRKTLLRQPLVSSNEKSFDWNYR